VYFRYVQGTTFLSVLRQLAAAGPDRPALTYLDQTLTRAEFTDRVERLAALFAARGVTEGSTVTIGLPNSIGFVESMFASPYRYVGATARSAADGWESLGDIGKVDADGYVYITDRLADMILVGGANVYPAEIEAALDEHPAVQSCCVIGLPDEDLGNIPYAIVELSGPASDEDLMAHLRRRLAPYKLPRVIERATTPLRDDAGKVRRSALRAERIAAKD
jgi:acyl-CoA synthetase (AMP-forming)/AMP-acid ligase II